MKRAKLAILVALAAFALASCDAMLEALFPEYGSDDLGAFGTHEIQITVFIGDGGGGYTPLGAPTQGPIRVVAVKWGYDFNGFPKLILDGSGRLDPLVHDFVISAPETLGAPSTPFASQAFTLGVPSGDFAVIVFEDVDGDGMPNDNETAAIATWAAPPQLFFEQFDVGYLEMDDPENSPFTVAADPLDLVHESYNDFNICSGAWICGDFDQLY